MLNLPRATKLIELLTHTRCRIHMPRKHCSAGPFPESSAKASSESSLLTHKNNACTWTHTTHLPASHVCLLTLLVLLALPSCLPTLKFLTRCQIRMSYNHCCACFRDSRGVSIQSEPLVLRPLPFFFNLSETSRPNCGITGLKRPTTASLRLNTQSLKPERLPGCAEQT